MEKDRNVIDKDWNSENLEQYEKNYSEDNLWKKIGKFAKKAGLEVIYYVLLLYYALQSDKVSKKRESHHNRSIRLFHSSY